MPTERRTVAEMLGEFLREIALLVSVFIPLDLAIESKPLTLEWIAAILIFGGGFLTVGVLIERRRKQ